MIVVDTSAIIAILGHEPEAASFRGVLLDASTCLISAATLVETTQVAARWGEKVATTDLDRLLAALKLEVVAFDAAQLRLTREAFLRFGKGRGHPAQLNLGDLFAYALAKSLDAPLLFKGDDFSKTDIKSARA